MPESAVLQSAPYKCLQSQFSVLYGEVTQVGVVIIGYSLIIAGTSSHGDLMVSVFNSLLSGQGLIPGLGHCVVFFDKG